MYMYILYDKLFIIFETLSSCQIAVDVARVDGLSLIYLYVISINCGDNLRIYYKMRM